MFRIPFRESNFEGLNSAGKETLTKRPAVTEVPETVGWCVSVSMAEAEGVVLLKWARTAPALCR